MLARVGLTFQDVLPQNMGVVTDDNGEPYVTLFDKSFMGLVSGTNCDESDLACQFCPEKSFVKTKTKRTNPIPGFETALA